MKHITHTPEQIIRQPKTAELLVGDHQAILAAVSSTHPPDVQPLEPNARAQQRQHRRLPDHLHL